MHTLQDYIHKQISGLLNNNNNTPIISPRHPLIRNAKDENPYLRSQSQNQNIFWRSFSRRINQIHDGQNEIVSSRHKNVSKVRKNAFYRDLLKAEQTINEKNKLKPVNPNKTNRIESHNSISSHRRLILQSHLENKKKEDLGIRLQHRQSSNAPDAYLKAKAKFDHKKGSSLINLRITKI